MNIKAKKAYPIHTYFEREKEYIKSKRISFFMLIILFLVLVVINISFVSQKVLEVAKAEFLEESIETTEYIKINNQEKRRLLADYSEFIIYNGYKEIKEKEETKQETRKEKDKKEVKKIKPKDENVKVAKSSQKAVVGSEVSKIKDMKNEAVANIVYMMERYKEYPKQARRLNAEGITNITFSIEKNGVVQGAEITKSSGYTVLDNAALKAAQKIVGLNAVNNNSYNEYLKVTVPVDFYLK